MSSLNDTALEDITKNADTSLDENGVMTVRLSYATKRPFSKRWKGFWTIQRIKYDYRKLLYWSICIIFFGSLIALGIATFIPRAHSDTNVSENAAEAAFGENSEKTDKYSDFDRKCEMAINLLTLAISFYLCKEISQNDESDEINITMTLCSENKQIRNKTEKAKQQMHSLNSALKNGMDFEKEYTKEEYFDLREFSFHFETIGNILAQNKIIFNLFFNIVTFPDWLMGASHDVKSENYDRMIEFVRNKYKSDFFIGVEYLYLTYEVKRKYNDYKSCRKPKYTASFNKKRKKEYKEALAVYKQKKEEQKSALKTAEKKWWDAYIELPV